MNRALAFIGALLAASLATSSASLGDTSTPIGFSLEQPRNNPTRIRASFHRHGGARNDNEWTSAIMPSELIGLEPSSFHGSGTSPIHFAVVRDAGRLDCAGTGGGGVANGTCRFTDDPHFTELLIRRGIGRPTNDQSFGLMAVNARRDLVDAVAAAHYPAPLIDELMALTAVGVDARYIADMARSGYRLQHVKQLIEFKALGVSPAWLSALARVGYGNVPGDDLMQLRALGITPDFILGFQRIGYRNLPVSTLVQLKALAITPEFVRSVARPGEPLPPVNKLMELRTFAGRH